MHEKKKEQFTECDHVVMLDAQVITTIIKQLTPP